MKTKHLIFLLLLFPTTLFAQDYYVDATGGSDVDTGTATDHAWQTLSKVSSSMGSFSAGDNIYLKRGEEWRESLSITCDGSTGDGNEITFGAYGTGNDPVISGATQMSSWTEESTNIWYAGSVSSNPDNVIFTESGPIYTWGYRESVKGSVNAKYDFWYDSTNSRIYTYSTSNPGTAYTSVDRSTRSYGLYVNGHNYIIIENLEIRFIGTGSQNNKAIELRSASDIEIRNCYLHHVGHREATEYGDVVYHNTGSGVWIHNNRIEEGGRHLVYIYASGTTSNDIIEWNYLYNGYHTHMDMNTGGAATSSGHIWRYNYAYFDGIDLDGSPGGFFMNGNGGSITNIYVYGNIYDGGMYYAWNLYSYDSNIYLYNNSLHLTAEQAGSYGVIVETTGISNVNVKNNNIWIDNAQSASGCYNINTTANVSIDYNVCYNPGGYIAYHGGFRDWTYWTVTDSMDANSYNENPDYNDAASKDLTLLAAAPGVNTGSNLGVTYDDALDSTQSWPTGSSTLDQDDYGAGWEIGAYVYGTSQSSPPIKGMSSYGVQIR